MVQMAHNCSDYQEVYCSMCGPSRNSKPSVTFIVLVVVWILFLLAAIIPSLGMILYGLWYSFFAVIGVL